jgi:hypothetical protein
LLENFPDGYRIQRKSVLSGPQGSADIAPSSVEKRVTIKRAAGRISDEILF